jgi:hypothetical protein
MNNNVKVYASKNWVEEKILNSRSDWNQNDESAPDYIKNRTHWVEQHDGKEVVHKLDGKYLPDGVPWIERIIDDIVPLRTVTPDPQVGMDMLGQEIGVALLGGDLGFVAGETYTVNYNGV